MSTSATPRTWSATIQYKNWFGRPLTTEGAPQSDSDLQREQLQAALARATAVITTAAQAGEQVDASIQLWKTTKAGTRRDQHWTAALDERTGRVRATR